MPDQTTIILVLLAGDSKTAGTLDEIVPRIQTGLAALSASDRPRVFCYYRRMTDSGTVREVFHNSVSALTGSPLTGSVEHQLSQFFTIVNGHLPASGRVHVLIGAHGVPAIGFRLALLVAMALRLLFSPFNRELRRLSWRSRWWLLYTRFFRIGHPVGRIALSASSAVELTLDAAAAALDSIPQSRRSVLILHTCNMSSTEALSAFSGFPRHIACENELKSVLPLADWVAPLANPSLPESQLVTDCFAVLNPSATEYQGTLAGTETAALPALFTAVNALGLHLQAKISGPASPGLTTRRSALSTAQSSAGIHGVAVDLKKFCERLKLQASLDCTAVADEVLLRLDAVRLHRFSNEGAESDWGGVALYLPYGSANLQISRLPTDFQAQADDWLSFVAVWSPSLD